MKAEIDIEGDTVVIRAPLLEGSQLRSVADLYQHAQKGDCGFDTLVLTSTLLHLLVHELALPGLAECAYAVEHGGFPVTLEPKRVPHLHVVRNDSSAPASDPTP